MSILNNIEKQRISIEKFNAYTYFGAAKQVLLFPYDYFFRNGKAGYPLNINLFLTLRCNARCKMCNLKQLLNKQGKEEISLEKIESLLKEIAKYKTSIVLFGGEPILRQDFLEALKLVKKYRLPCGIFTNGTLFNSELIKDIINLKMNFVAFSLQGIKNHDKIVGIPGAYDKMIKAIKEFVRYKSRKTKVILHTTIWEDNLDELGEIVELGERLGVDLIRFGHPTFFTKKDIELNKKVMAKIFPDEKIEEISCSYEPGEKNKLYYEKLRKFMQDYKGRFHMTPDLNLDEIKNWYSTNFNSKRKCYFVYRGCFIYPNGDVVPCESFGFVMGNTNKQKFMDIWNSKKYIKFRRGLKKGLYPGCARCCKL